MTEDREVLDWATFGSASRELAGQVSADGFQPDLILAIARAGSSSLARSATRWRSRTCTS
ncbi:hypothetical protein [Phytohabitans rumicis]|uniref:hypothetical protein n=1 Tax=Phytohabitans rumicis TaxID=1076125 RepID=UPI001FE7B5F9|nr:hypothetical protein [Phytohabitans rumicis]